MKRVPQILFLIIAIAINSCKRNVALFDIQNLNSNQISCFGHGGMGVKFEYPIDTYESFEPCLRIGADGTEMDVQLTKDSVLIAYHHGDLNDGTGCSGAVNDKLWSEIWGCHFASPLSSNINLISLNDLYDRLPTADKCTFTFDCKLYNNQPDQHIFQNQFANAILNFKTSHHLSDDRLFVESTDSTFIRKLKEKDPQLRLFIYPTSFTEGLEIAKTLHIFGITISNDNITEQEIKLAHEQGFRVAVWNTQSENDNISAIYKSPDFIQSDEIIHLLKVFGKYKK